MNVTVRLFAAHRELTGTSSIEISLPERSTVGALVSVLRRRGGVWASLPESGAVAVNRRYATHRTVLEAGDEVALIPPVAGG